VATNIEQNTNSPFTLYWGIEPDDVLSIRAAEKTGHPIVLNKYTMGYSNTIQTIYEQAKEPIFFHANDDFYFPKDWDKPHMQYLKDHPEVMALGVPDGTASEAYSTITFIRRKYIKEQSGVADMPNRVFYPYNHNFQDTEFTKTAQHRGVWDACTEPCIDHRREGDDETYQKNNATYGIDAEVYGSRRHLFNG